MSYVGVPFVHDIFLSYSHGEREQAPDAEPRLKQWSVAFARELQAELRECIGGGITFFIDASDRPEEGLSPWAPLTQQLQTGSDAAVLLVLISPKYRQSRWCEAERTWWLERQAALGIPAAGRLAVVHVLPPPEPLPPGIADARGEAPMGFWFYERAGADLRTRPYDWPAPTPTSKDPFRRAVVELAGRLADKLKEIREHLEMRAKLRNFAKRLGGHDGQAPPLVYLHGRATQRDAWTDVRATLRKSGLIVVPGAPEPVVADARYLQQIRQHRVQAMSGCDALLLVSAQDEWAVDADLVVVGRHDRASARALSNRPLPCALIDAVGPPIATPERKDAARDLNVEWIDATRSPWTPAVRAWLGVVAQAEDFQ